MPRNGEQGFTLIEILVVLLIVTVLSAIAFPLFVNQRAKAQDANAKTALRVAAGAIEVYHQDHNTFAGADADALKAIEPSLDEARNLAVDADDDGYTLSVDSASGGHGGGPFTIEHTFTTTVRNCAGPGKGGCPGLGQW
jgi:prepilin-type N-terminal cleavage/methylation domain-containing protein